MKEIEAFRIKFKNLETEIQVCDVETLAKYNLLSHLNMTANFLVDAAFSSESPESLPEAYLPYSEKVVLNLKEQLPEVFLMLEEYKNRFPPNFLKNQQAEGLLFYDKNQTREANLKRFAQECGGVLSTNLLMELANFLPGFGFYSRPATEVATIEYLKQKTTEAAFVTLPGMDERWRLGLSKHVKNMYQALEKEHQFSSHKPFVCLYVGDANSIAREAVSRQLQKQGAFFKNIVVDLSPALLRQQQDKRLAENEEFIQGNVLNLSELVSKPITGFLFAGHELIDDFPVHVLLETALYGIKEVYFIPKDQEFEYPLGPVTAKILEKFPELFPWYKFLLNQGLVPVNVSHLILIQEVNKTLESGYWYIGDYCHNFTWAAFDPEEIPLRALRPRFPIQEPIEAIFTDVCNYTTDVDPGLFSLAEALSMKRIFIGSQGDFLAQTLKSVAREKIRLNEKFFQNLVKRIKEADFKDPTTKRRLQEEVFKIGIWDPDVLAFIFAKNALNYLS